MPLLGTLRTDPPNRTDRSPQGPHRAIRCTASVSSLQCAASSRRRPRLKRFPEATFREERPGSPSSEQRTRCVDVAPSAQFIDCGRSCKGSCNELQATTATHEALIEITGRKDTRDKDAAGAPKHGQTSQPDGCYSKTPTRCEYEPFDEMGAFGATRWSFASQEMGCQSHTRSAAEEDPADA
jgi:hypothetical protein